MKVRLTYFRHSGKYYTEGEYEHVPYVDVIGPVYTPMFQIWEEVRGMLIRGVRPGLVKGNPTEFIVSVDVPDHPHNHPCLIMPSTLG